MSDIHETTAEKSGFWTMNFGQVVTMVVFVFGVIYGMGVFTSKSSADIDVNAKQLEQISARLQRLDERDAAYGGRISAVETGISYIRESQARTEQTLNELLQEQAKK